MNWNWLLLGISPIYTWEAGLMFLVLLVLLLFVAFSGRDSCNIQNSLTLNCEATLQIKVPSWQALPLLLP